MAHDGDGRPRVSGLIDFGDIQSNYYVFELALTCMYMMLDCKTMDPLDAPAHVLAGYASQRPIPAHEFRLLKVHHLISAMLLFFRFKDRLHV